MTFREDLPQGCPPDEASEIVSPTVVFRLIAGDTAKDEDFRSQRAMNPERTFQVPECLARGLSVHADIADSIKASKMPIHQTKRIAKLNLDRGAGFIEGTFRGSHRTWWPYKDFDVIGSSEVVEQ